MRAHISVVAVAALALIGSAAAQAGSCSGSARCQGPCLQTLVRSNSLHDGFRDLQQQCRSCFVLHGPAADRPGPVHMLCRRERLSERRPNGLQPAVWPEVCEFILEG